MLAAGHGGAIVNVGSVNSFLGAPYVPAYVALKHALIGLTSSVSAELAPQAIRVNLICPGFIDIADMCVFLASVGASYLDIKAATAPFAFT